MKKKFKTKQEAYMFWNNLLDDMCEEELKEGYQHYINKPEEVEGVFIIEYGKIKAAQEKEIKTMTNKISVLNAEYKNGYDAEKLMLASYKEQKETELKKIYDDEIALIDKKKEYGKLTIEEEELARIAANDRLLKAQQQLNADLNNELVKKLDYEMSLVAITDKQRLANAQLNEDERYKISVESINKKYEAEKEKINLTITDETDRNRKIELLQAQHNVDIATADKAHRDIVNAQKLADEQSVLESKYALMKDGVFHT